MKKVLLLTTLLILGSCFNQESELGEEKIENEFQNSIVEENDACICTKEFNPVCGNDGITYPSPCQAGCEDVTEFTEGACQDD